MTVTDSESAAHLVEAYKLNRKHGILSRQEILLAVEISKKRHSDKLLQFIEINFQEPSKNELIESYLNNTALIRRAEVISLCLVLNQTFIDTVILSIGEKDGYLTIDELDLSEPNVNSSNDSNSNNSDINSNCNVKNYDNGNTIILKAVQAGISPDEYAFIEVLCKGYQPLLDVLAARGLDPTGLKADAWCVGHTGPDCDPTERVCWPSLYYLGTSDAEKDDLLYARPIEGIEIRISLTHKKIIRFEDNSQGAFSIPGSMEGVDTKYVPKSEQRKDLKPIVISQPDGPSFVVSNTNTVEWQKWRFQIGFNSREGATLHGLTYLDRPIMHKMSFCEMVVPYGDPRPPHSMKNAFDAGEDGFGRNANSLCLGCDCLGVIHYFDANLVNDSGEHIVTKNAICMHEEDCGMAWKHTDWRTGVPEVRRNRRLVVSFVCTIANYDYGFAYHLYLDGTIETDVKLTGVLSTGAYSTEDQVLGKRKYGVSLGGNLYTPVHQHFFVVRMDFCVDGVNNSIVEYNAEAESEGPHNPDLNAFFFKETLLATEKEAIRDLSPETARLWKVISSNAKNHTGYPTGYKLMPAPKCLPFAPLARAAHLKRAQFLAHQIWVTAFDAREKYPGGDFPNQNPGVDGLPLWTEKDRSIKHTDLVVWHVFGVTHLPRLEDWPIMPVEHLGFHLKPSGFFAENPASDVPIGNGSCSNSSSSSSNSSHCEGV